MIHNLGLGQKMTLQTRYTYEGPQSVERNRLEKIRFVHQSVEFGLTPKANAAFEVKKSDMKVIESEGELLFDAKRGRLYRSHEKVRIQGDLTFSASGQEFPGKLDLTIESTQTSK